MTSSFYPPSVVIPIYAVLIGVGIFLTGLRIWVRVSYTRRSLGADDIFMVIGTAVAASCTAIQFYNALRGLAGDAASEQDEQKARVVLGYKIDFAMIVVEKAAFGAIKLSLLLFYRRIFSVWPSFSRINHALIILVAAWTLSFILADLFLCGSRIDLQFAFDQTKSRRECRNKGALLIAFAATSVLTDALVLGLPLVYIRRLQMPQGKIIAASVVFLLGTVSTLAGILRLVFLCVAYPLGRLDFGYTAPANAKTPLVLQVFNPTFWVMVEMGLGVWAANIPPLRPLLKYSQLRLGVSRIWLGLSGSEKSGGNAVADVKEPHRRSPCSDEERLAVAHRGPSFPGSQSFDSYEIHPDTSSSWARETQMRTREYS